MSAQENTKTVVARQRKITVEDIRRKAERVQQVAQDDVQRLVREEQARGVIVAAVGVAVVVSLAYYLGTRAGRRPGHAPVPPAE